MIGEEAKVRRAAQLKTPSDLGADATKDLSGALNILLADLFALYVKTKNFHWHVSGPNFRDYHLMLDERAEQIFAITDTVADASSSTYLQRVREDIESGAASGVRATPTFFVNGVPQD